jgi:hypothetical protein
MSLFKRLEGIFFNPKPVFDSLAEKPVWADALVLLLILLIAFTALIHPYLQNDQLQLLRDNTAFKERLGEDRYNEAIQNLENPSTARKVIQIFVTTPISLVVFLLFQSLIILALGRFVSTQGNYKQVFSILLHANFVDKLLGNAVRLILAFSRKSVMQTSTGLALFFPKMEITSNTYVILANIDFFQLWLFGILSYGLAAIFKVDVKKALFVSYGFWILKTLVNIGIGIVGLSFAR